MNSNSLSVVFLTPPALTGGKDAERVFGCTYGLYPIPNLFILQAAAMVRKSGHKVSFRDCPVMGINGEKFLGLLHQEPMDLLCIYSVNLSRTDDLEALRLIRELRGQVPVVFFGPSPTWEPEAYLIDEKCFVIRGEPEETLSEFSVWLGSKGDLLSTPEIPGMSARNRNDFIHNPPRESHSSLDSLPFPARDLLNRNAYYNPKLGVRPFTALLTSRGCAFKCRYCVPCSLSFAREMEGRRALDGKKPKVALRSAGNVIEEIRELKAQGYRAVSIIDDQFVWGKERTVKICEALAGGGFRWGCLARADTLSEDVARAFAEYRCRYVDVGVESFDQRVLDDVGKSIKVETIIERLSLLKKHSVPFKLNILVGASPFETRESFRTNRKIAKELAPDSVMFNICNPFPGTPFWDVAVKEKWLITDGYTPVDVQKQATISYPALTNREIEREVRRANLSFFLNPRFIIKGLRRTASLRDLVGAVKSLLRKFF
ncbi:B12-binding domain-containing radical SAM protein [Acidobacteriota bacterium]